MPARRWPARAILTGRPADSVTKDRVPEQNSDTRLVMLQTLESFDDAFGFDGLLQVASLPELSRQVVVTTVLHPDLKVVPPDPEDHGQNHHEHFRPNEGIDGAEECQVAVPVFKICCAHDMSPVLSLTPQRWANAPPRWTLRSSPCPPA